LVRRHTRLRKLTGRTRRGDDAGWLERPARDLLWRRPAMKNAPTVDTQPWWLHDEQSCDYCLQRHAVGLELRCRTCDEIVCADCAVVVVETRVTITVCPACAPRGPATASRSAPRRR
jgi:hypothetical protein